MTLGQGLSVLRATSCNGGGGCRDPVQINNWISETRLPAYLVPSFSELHGTEIARRCFA